MGLGGFPPDSRVCLFYGSAHYTCLQPTHSYGQAGGKSFSLFDTVVTLALSLLTHNLRPDGVQGAVRRLRGGQSVERAAWAE